MLHGGKLTDFAFKEAESVLHNPGFFRQDFQPLFLVDPVPERAGAGNDSSVGNLAVKYNGVFMLNRIVSGAIQCFSAFSDAKLWIFFQS